MENIIKRKQSRLGPDDAAQIRKRYLSGDRVVDLAVEFKCSVATVYLVLRGQWRAGTSKASPARPKSKPAPAPESKPAPPVQPAAAKPVRFRSSIGSFNFPTAAMRDRFDEIASRTEHPEAVDIREMFEKIGVPQDKRPRSRAERIAFLLSHPEGTAMISVFFNTEPPVTDPTASGV